MNNTAPVNYQKMLDRLISDHECKQEVPTLLLHSCCGPCSSYVLFYLSKYFDITLFYYNPNILPEAEYKKRLETQKQLLSVLPTERPIELIEGDYDSDRFLLAAKGLENEPEGGKRCAVCFQMRLDATAKLAKELNCAYFCSTLSVSPHKNATVLADISTQLSDIYEVNALPADFKKKGGYLKSVELAKTYGLYRQDSCGCPFSVRAHI